VGSRRDGKALLPCFVLNRKLRGQSTKEKCIIGMQNIHVDGFDQILPGVFFSGAAVGGVGCGLCHVTVIICLEMFRFSETLALKCFATCNKIRFQASVLLIRPDRAPAAVSYLDLDFCLPPGVFFLGSRFRLFFH
jgi:hypothetical protein